MAEITIPIVLQLIQTVALLVGIIYYITIMRNQQRTRELTLESQELTRKAQEQALETRETQLFMNIFNTYSSGEFIEAFSRCLRWNYENFDDFMKKYGWLQKPYEEINWDDVRDFNILVQWYEGLGFLVKRGLISSELVFGIMYGTIAQFWLRFEPLIFEMRERWKSEVLEDIEFLYTEMKRLRDEYETLGPTDEVIRRSIQ